MDESNECPPRRPNRVLREIVGDDIEALIRFAHFSPPAEAVAIARWLLHSGAWSRSVGDLRGLLDNKLQPLSEWPDIASTLLQVIEEDHLTHRAVRAETHELIELLARRGPDAVRVDLASWFVTVAEPGEPRLAIRLLHSSFERPDGASHASLRPWCRPLARWLVDRGAAEFGPREAELLIDPSCGAPGSR